MYKFIDKAKNREEEKELMTKAMILKLALSEEDQLRIDEEFQIYRDTLDAEGKAFKPYYRYIINRVVVKLESQ